MYRICAAIVLSMLILSGCATEQKKPFSFAVEEMNDMARFNKVQAEASRMLKEDQATSMTLIREGLKQSKCELELPEVQQCQTMSASEIYEECSESVLLVAGLYKCTKCTNWHASPASGFFITQTGAFVTNYHVVNNQEHKTMVIMTRSGEVYPVRKVLAANKIDDVAILQAELPEGVIVRPVPLSPDTPVGAQVTCISHPSRRYFSLTQGRISRYYQAYKSRDLKNVASMMTVTADFAGGSSGGPLFNEYGALAGLVSSTSTVYAKPEEKTQVQMVFKQCVPTKNVLKLIK